VENLIGKEGDGFKYAMKGLDGGAWALAGPLSALCAFTCGWCTVECLFALTLSLPCLPFMLVFVHVGDGCAGRISIGTTLL
jgi:hypothetical protein